MRLPRRGATAAVAVAAVVLTGCTGDESGIEVAAAARSTVTEVVEAPATVQARATTTLTAPAAGEVAQVYVKDGEQVGPGTLIVRISSPETTGRLTQARSALAQAESAAPGAPAYVSGGPLAEADSSAQGAFEGARKAAEQIPDPRLRAAALIRVAGAERQYALAAAQARSAVAAINSGIGDLSAALASLTVAQQVQARAAVDAAERAVEALDVRTPIGGTVQLGGSSSGAGTGAAGGTGGLDSVLGQLPADVQDQASAPATAGPVDGEHHEHDYNLADEDVPPGPGRRHVAADQRTGRDGSAGGAADHPVGERALLTLVVRGGQRGDRRDHQHRAEPLDPRPADQQHREVRAERRDQRAQPVHGQAESEGPVATQDVAELGADEHERRHHERVHRDRALHASDRRVEVGHDLRDRDVHHARVEHHDELGRREDHQGQPLAHRPTLCCLAAWRTAITTSAAAADGR